MANAKELKALITLSGKLDPSLQKALLDAAGKTKRFTGQVGLLGLAGNTAKTGLLKVAGGIMQSNTGLGAMMRSGKSAILSMSKFTKENKVASAALVSLRKAGSGTMGALRKGAKFAAVGLAGLAAAGVVALGAVAAKGVQVASDLQEVQNVVDVTFGEQGSQKINGWSQCLLNAYGLSELSAKKYSSTLGAMLKSSGMADEQTMQMSQNLTMLAGDMASFYNLDSETAFEKLRSGISGETEPLKQLGINMSVANLQAYAMSQGIKKSYGEMSQAEQTALRYNYIMQATSDAQGDFSRTSGSFANQQKLLRENFSQLAGKIMTGVLPALAKLMQVGNQAMASVDTELLSSIVNSVADLLVNLAPIGEAVLPLISTTLGTLLPPLVELVKIVVPPLTKLLELIVGKASQGIAKLGELLNAGVGWIKGKVGGGEPAADVPQFARGGFSDRPAIFGEAGLEAAIPIRPGSRRSLSLLSRTAELLGVRFGSTVINYRPVIRGGKASEIQDVLRRHSQELAEMLDARDNRRRRLSFDPC